MKLLIVDDEWIIADSLSTMEEWSERGLGVAGIAHNGYEAIRMLEDDAEIRLVISDIRMPDMDGLQLLQYIYEEKPDTQVILVSGYEDFAYARTALKYGAKGYLLKPIDTDELLEAVDRVLAQLKPPKADTAVAQLDAPPEAMSEAQPEAPMPELPYHADIVQRAKQYIQAHLHAPLSLSDVAETVHLTPHYLGQIFKNGCGMLFNTYLTQVRMEKACSLLVQTDLRIYEICERVGYIDSKYFGKVFQKHTGMTPNDYRQRHRG
ncbi:response regulator transcription factor [Paenibacillus methanolicus]|uniref:Helix-turn-helix protein n=1 Tax=Paenibacillus methanolicus TaxID=582686 RepID=A0A5S5BY53_9BACL|nr:response regulator [Paenibacillus methanolicus]TYP71967.1 helix-turn-helix protein [Paenibacillus methanolicus]